MGLQEISGIFGIGSIGTITTATTGILAILPEYFLVDGFNLGYFARLLTGYNGIILATMPFNLSHIMDLSWLHRQII